MDSRLYAASDPDGLGPLYGVARRKLLKRRHRGEWWIKVLDLLLVVLVAGDFANLFLAVESSTRSGYPIIIAITVALTLLCVILPFLAGKSWRQRAGGSRESSYVLVAVLTLMWIALVAFITLLRLKAEGAALPGADVTTSVSGSAIANLGAASSSLRPGSAQALTWLLTVMLLSSGIVAFTSAWAAADPVRVRMRRLESQRLDLIEAHEGLLALNEEYRHNEGHLEQLVGGDEERYEAARLQILHHAEYLKSLVRTRMAEHLADPASTSILSQTVEPPQGTNRPQAVEPPQGTNRPQAAESPQGTERSDDEHERFSHLDQLPSQKPATGERSEHRGAA